MADGGLPVIGKSAGQGYRALLRLTDYLSYFVLATMAITVTVDVFCRYFLGFSTQVAGEIASLGLVALIFISLPGAFADGSFLRVDALYTHLRGRAKRLLDAAFVLIALVVTLVYVVELARLVENSFEKQIRSDTILGTPNYLPQCAMVFGLVVLAIALVSALACTVRPQPPMARPDD